MFSGSEIRIGLFAEAFGFGPASKVTAIGRACRDKLNAKLIPIGTSITCEYFTKEKLGEVIELDILAGISNLALDEICDMLDLAIVGLQPEWASVLSGRVPVAYVDSLGFMWDASFFSRYPKLKEVDAYIAQDFFGAAVALRHRGVSNLVPTGAIVQRTHAIQGDKRGWVVHLGGLFNIFSQSDGEEYAKFALRLVHGLASEVLVSGLALRNLSEDSFAFSCLENEQVIQSFSKAEVVITSPGLTALLELASLGANVVPLPPQNYSQALIVSFLAERSSGNSLWSFLAKHYSVSRNESEAGGVALVRAMNKKLAASKAFAMEYRRLVASSMNHRLPDEFTSGGDGVAQAVDAIERLVRAGRCGRVGSRSS